MSAVGPRREFRSVDPPADPPADPGTDLGPDRGGRAARGVLWSATNAVVVKAAQTTALLVLAALLAPAALGVLALVTLIVNVASVVAGLGTAGALVYWRGDVLRAARTAVTVALVVGSGLAAMLWVAAPGLVAVLQAPPQAVPALRGLGLTVPLLAVASVTHELLRRRLAFLRRVVPDLVASLVGATVTVALALGGQGLMALVVGQAVAAVLALLLCWCVHLVVRPGWSTVDARGLVAYGMPLSGAALVQLVLLNLDYLVVSVALGAAALGQYSVAFRLAFVPYLMVAVVLAGVAFPYLCRLERPRVPEAAVRLTATTVTLVLPLCLGLLVLADHLVLLGEQWRPGVPVLGLLAAYAVMLSVAALVQTTLDAVGRPGLALALRLAHLAVLVPALGLATRGGIVAVAAAQLVVAAVAALVALRLVGSVVPGFTARALGSALRPAAAATVAMLVVMLLVRVLLGTAAGLDVGVLTLLLTGVAGAASYAAVTWTCDRDRVRALLLLVRSGR